MGAVLAIGLTACEKDDIDTYNAEYNAVRFISYQATVAENELGGNAYSSADECLYGSYSFLENPFGESYDYSFGLTLVGKVSDSDYQVSYSVDTERTTAPEGSYEIVEAKIPAGSMYGQILVRVKNVEALQTETYELYLKLESSDKLPVGPKEFLLARLAWNNQILEPPHNNLVRSYNMLVQGTSNFVSTSKSHYSSSAMKAIVAATGWDDWDDESIHGTKYNNATTYQSYKYLPRYTWIYSDNSYKGYAAMLRDYLKKYEEEYGEPLLHDAGAFKGQPIVARTY